MDFEPIYSVPRDEAVRSLRGRIECHPRFQVKPDALAIAEEKQARKHPYDVPAVQETQRTPLWVKVLSAIFALAVLGGMGLLLAMWSAA